MTQNEIAYQRNVETERNNRAVETETNRHNVANENIGWYNAYETNRHNTADEDLRQQAQNESVRHNLVQEDIGYANVGLGYTNAAIAQQNANTAWGNLIESSRHNSAVEAETQRANNNNFVASTLASERSSEATKYAADKRAESAENVAYINNLSGITTKSLQSVIQSIGGK